MLTAMGRRDISRFLRHLWVSRYGDIKNTGLFPAIRSKVEGSKLNSLEFVRDCNAECANCISIITFSEEHLGGLAPTYPELATGTRRTIGASYAAVVLQRFEPREFEAMVRWLIVFIARWSAFLKLDSADLERLVFEMAKNACEIPTDQAKKARLGILKEKLRKAAPPDDQIDAAVDRMVLPVDSAEYIVKKLSDAMGSKTKEKGTTKESN